MSGRRRGRRERAGGGGPGRSAGAGGAAGPPARNEDVAAGGSAPPPGPRPGRAAGRRARFAVAGLVVAAAALAAVLLLRRGDGGGGEPIAFPAPPTAVPAAPAWEDFVGAERCAECHGVQYETWRASTHGRAGGEPAADVVLRAFDGRPIRFRDATVTPRVLDDGGYAFVVAEEGRAPLTVRVEGVTGGAHMVGGGTQGFFTRWSDGTLRFLPFEMIRRDGVWFCNTDTRLDRGWQPITADMRLADCGDWPPVRVQGQIARYGNCQQCHGSQIDVAPEPGRAHATRLQSWAVDCESCHGPGRAHIEAVTGAADGADPADIGYRPLATLDTDASLEVCFRCHALKDALRPGYLPGATIDDFYSLALPLLGDEPVFPDGRIRTFAYQQQHLWSDCYLSGAMTCTDCHEPHGQGYRDVVGNPLPGRFDDRQCTSCHESKADPIEAHTRHAAASAGSRCVACHMPYLQEPEVGSAIRYARSDHTIPVPRPASDAALGIEVACAACHEDRDAATLQRDVERLWGTLKPRPAIVDALLLHEPTDAAAARAALLDAEPGAHRMALFTALARVLTASLRPDGGLDAALAARLRDLTQHADDDVASAALAALHYAAGDERAVRRTLAARLDTLGEASTPVRSRWAVILGSLGDTHRERGDAAAAIRTYTRALEVRPDHAPTLLSLGLAHAQAGNLAEAVTHYRRSLQHDPARALAHVNLGIALAALGDAAGAERAYRDAVAVDVGEALAYFNLANLYLRAGRAVDAVFEYEKALAADPALAAGWFNLARAHGALGNRQAALEAVERGLVFAPDDAGAVRLRTQLLNAEAPPRTSTGSNGR